MWALSPSNSGHTSRLSSSLACGRSGLTLKCVCSIRFYRSLTCDSPGEDVSNHMRIVFTHGCVCVRVCVCVLPRERCYFFLFFGEVCNFNCIYLFSGILCWFLLILSLDSHLESRPVDPVRVFGMWRNVPGSLESNPEPFRPFLMPAEAAIS